MTELAKIEADILARLADAAANRRSPMHTPAIATADADVRIMVLRAFDPAGWSLRFHTDARSPKRLAIEADARLAALFYDPAAKLQLRCRGKGAVLTDGPLVDAAWRASSEYARRCYLAQAAPGAPAAGPVSGLPPEVEGIRPSEAQLLPARANFAVLLLQVEEVDWLHLAHDGHRRARFTIGAGGHWAIP